jgi:sugar-specific transcriptional regulator TrmB
MSTERIESIMTGLGFSLYESRAYAALVGEHPLTGYELSGRSGIPRSKVYECIERLKRKGLVLPVEGNPVRYVPVPPDELVRRLTSEFRSSVNDLEELLRRETTGDDVEYIFNLRGYEGIVGKAREIVDGAREQLDLALWDDELELLRGSCAEAAGRGVRIRLLSFGEGALDGAEVYRHRQLADSEFTGRWITVIRDGCEIITGECPDGGSGVAAWTRNRSLVYMSLKYIDHEILRIREGAR